MEIYIPEKFYNAFPAWCVTLAVLFMFMPHSVLKIVCITYLLSYSGYVLFRRLQERASDKF